MNLIKKNILIGELIEKFPKAADVLVNKYGFHCVGCMAAGGETLEEGAMVHGFSQKEVKLLIEDLNKSVSLVKANKK